MRSRVPSMWEVTVTRQLKYLAILATIGVAVSGLVYGDDDGHAWKRHRDNDDRGAYGHGAYRGDNQQYYDRAYRDGLNQGQYDRSSNRRNSYKRSAWRQGDSSYGNAYRSHSYRPTQGDNYKHADRGYDSRMGNKDGYKQTYRSGYVNGYQPGYQRGR